MVVGLFELESATWFFKIIGPSEQVTQVEQEWKPFLSGVRFENGQPKWDLPKGWRMAKDRPMRFATLEFGDFDPPLELAISSLAANQDRLLNVNRWRGQLGLTEIDETGLQENLSQLGSAENAGLLFDAVGKSTGAMMPPFAGGPFSGQTPPGNVADTKSPGVLFDLPDGWIEGKISDMVPVRLQRTEGEETAQITVIPLPAAANEWEPNAQRWAREVGLTEMTVNELNEVTSQIEVDGKDGQLLNLSGVASESERSTIAGMVKYNGTAWFLKLSGDKQLVKENEDLFAEFLSSLKLPNN